MLLQFKDAVYKIRYTIDEMQTMTGLGNKVSMQDFAIIEDKVQITHGKKKALKEPIRIGIVVFDMRLNLRRLPPYNSRDDAKTKVYIAVHNGHAYSFKNWEQARNIMRTSLSYFEGHVSRQQHGRRRSRMRMRSHGSCSVRRSTCSPIVTPSRHT